MVSEQMSERTSIRKIMYAACVQTLLQVPTFFELIEELLR